MASPLAPDVVRRIAALARLELTPEEVELFSRQLGDILNYVDELRAIDTTGVEPTSHPLAAAPAWREDEPVPSLDRDAVLRGAPGASPAAGLFKVPKVL
jgi:aspartyl-tRNA(Asn)/glutamyl-tRNA(Gln) amidotransferase subunit C